MSDTAPTTSDGVVEIHCPHCGAGHPVRQQVLGKLGRCSKCGQRFVLRLDEEPKPSGEPAPSPVAAPPAPHVAIAPPPPPPPVATAVESPAEAPSVIEPPPMEPPLAPPAAPAILPAEPLAAASPAIAPARPRQEPLPVRALRWAAFGAEVMAALMLVGAVLGAIVAAAWAASRMSEPGGALGVLWFAGSVLVGWGASAITFYLAAQLVRLALLIERHSYETLLATQATAAACEKTAEPPRPTPLPTAAPLESDRD